MSSAKSISPLISACTIGSGGLVDLEDDLVHVRRAAPVVRVGLELVRRAAGGALDQPERAGADDRLAVRRLGGVASSAAFSATFFQMCSGTIGIGSSGSVGVGLREREHQASCRRAR